MSNELKLYFEFDGLYTSLKTSKHKEREREKELQSE